MNNQKSHKLLTSLFSAQESIFFSFFNTIQYPWELHEKLPFLFLQKKRTQDLSFPSVYFINKKSVFIEKGVTIKPGAMIEGPCYLGSGVSIGHCAYIRAGSFLAPGVHIGHCSEISRSIFFENAKAPHFNYVGDSIIGSNVNLGAHVVLTNLRLDKKEIAVFWEGEKILTGKRKFGALVGDNTSIGAGVILNPGTIVQKNSKISPLTTHKGSI